MIKSSSRHQFAFREPQAVELRCVYTDEWTYEGKTYQNPIIEIVDIESKVATARKIMF